MHSIIYLSNKRGKKNYALYTKNGRFKKRQRPKTRGCSNYTKYNKATISIIRKRKKETTNRPTNDTLQILQRIRRLHTRIHKRIQTTTKEINNNRLQAITDGFIIYSVYPL